MAWVLLLHVPKLGRGSEWHMGALRDIEFFLADHNSCGGLQVRTCPPTSAVGYYLALTCCCGGLRAQRAVAEQAVFNPVSAPHADTSNRHLVGPKEPLKDHY